MANSQPSNNMPLNVFGDTVEQEVNAFGDPVEPHPGEIQKLNRTELAKLPQFQPEKVSMLDKLAGPLADYVVGPIANIPNTIRGVAAEGMNLPFRAARAMGLYPESQQRMRISPDQFDENGNVVPGSISQSNVPVPLPYNANYAPHIPFNPTPIQPTEPEGQALVNKVLGMATPDVILGGLSVNPKTLAAFFAPQMIAQVPQVVQHGAEQVMNPTLSGREKVGAAGNTLADLLMTLAVTHGALPETQHPSGLTRNDIPGYTWEDVRRFQMPNKPGIEMPDKEQPKTFETPIIGQRPLTIEQPIINPNDTTPLQQPNIVSAYQPTGEPKQGGQISFEGSAGGIPNALQQHQPSLAQMLEDAIKKNQIEKSDLTRSEGGGEKILAQQTSKETSLPTTSDFEQYSELRQQAKGFSAKGEFPPSELLRQMEEIKNRNKGMPPKEETTVPLNERLQARLKAFNDAQAKRIQSGDSMGRIDAGLLEDVVNIGRLVYGSAKDFASWSGEMVKKLGEHVKPHLQEVWDNVKRAYDTRPTNTAMVMQAGELVSQPAKLRLGLDKEGKYDAGQAVARLRNTLGESSAEWQVLKETGIQERFKPGQKVTPEELRGWVDENGPKVEVRKFGDVANPQFGAIQREHTQMVHEWFDNQGELRPLINDYEEAINSEDINEQEGADAIAISDAETAMMTEGHDRLAQHRWLVRNENGEVLADAPSKQDAEEWVQMNEESRRRTFPDKRPLKATIEEKVESLDQEPGMHLHYDRTLPKIVEELTGQKGERVELGEHKMAYGDQQDMDALNQRGVTRFDNKMRKDLIFRNQDNTPKTSISAKMFDLSKVTDEPKTLFGKDRPSEVNVEKTKEALAPRSGGINTKVGGERKGEAGSVSLQGFKNLGDATEKAIKGLSVDFQVLKDSFNRASEFRDVVMKNQAIEGGALTTATRAENHVNLEATRIFGKDSEIARNAAITVLESKRDKAMLPTFLKQAAKNKEAIEGIKFAQANWNKLQPLADAIEAVDTFNRSTAKAAGVEIPYLSDYLKRAYERDTGWLTRPKVQPGTGMSSRLKRQYDSIYEAIEDGHSPVSFDSAALVGKRTREIFNEVNQHLWVEHLKNTKDSVTGEPILTDITGKGKVRLPPEGYVKVELPSGKSLGVLEGYDRLIKALTGESDIANSLAGRVLLETQQGIKHSTLAFDFFHLSRVAMFRKSFALKNMYKKGLSILEFSDADLNEAKNQGLIDQATVDYSRGKVDTSFGPISRREVVSLGIKNGLGVGRHSEALYTSFIRSIPLVGDLNRFIFDKFTRGAIAESFVNKFSEQSKYHPTMSKAAVAQMVARDINFRMGNIQKQGIFKSATMQDLLRIPLLAPSWVESMAQSEARSVGQVGKALLPGKNFMKPGVLGKSTAALVASFVVGTQVINMLSKGQPTWKNGDGHQLDAWVPPVTKNGKGFWISPLSVAAEITHDLLRFSRKGSAVDASARIAENKLSPLGQGAKLFITGQDWKGEEHHGGDRLWSAIAAAFNPMPLIGKQAIASVQSKDVAPLERQAFALGGVKAEPESYNEQKQRIIDNMKSGKSMTLFERKQLEEQLKSLRQTPSDAAKVAITTRATEQMLERKNGLRDELPDDIKSWLKHENLDITGFANAFGYRKTRIGLTQDEADRYKEIVKDAYVQFLSAHVGQQMTQQKLDGVLIKAKNYARKQMKGEMQQ